MFQMIRTRLRHGRPAVPDLDLAEVQPPFRGLPSFDSTSCDGCGTCASTCPPGAIELGPAKMTVSQKVEQIETVRAAGGTPALPGLSVAGGTPALPGFFAKPSKIDLGKCVFCGECVRGCTRGSIRFTPEHRMAASRRDDLVLAVPEGGGPLVAPGVTPRQDLRKIFRRSLKLRQVSAGGCNGCEMELGACGNVNFDMGRFGASFVASPRHADGVVVTGPVTASMASALEDSLAATPEPRIVVAVGACAISGGAFASAPSLDRRFFAGHAVDLYVPGCPPHPLAFIHGLRALLGLSACRIPHGPP